MSGLGSSALPPQGQNIDINYLKFFCEGDFLFSLFIYSTIALHQYGLGALYFILCAVIQHHFIYSDEQRVPMLAVTGALSFGFYVPLTDPQPGRVCCSVCVVGWPFGVFLSSSLLSGRTRNSGLHLYNRLPTPSWNQPLLQRALVLCTGGCCQGPSSRYCICYWGDLARFFLSVK